MLKKIHFIYINNIADLITFLWSHYALDKPMTAGIFVDSIDQYFGCKYDHNLERFSFEENGRNIMIVINLLSRLC